MTDHKANAVKNLRSLHDWQSDEGITDATLTTVAIEAVVQATLYLAEQQRTANLIAYVHLLDNEYDSARVREEDFDWSTYESSLARHARAQHLVREGLGLA